MWVNHTDEDWAWGESSRRPSITVRQSGIATHGYDDPRRKLPKLSPQQIQSHHGQQRMWAHPWLECAHILEQIRLELLTTTWLNQKSAMLLATLENSNGRRQGSTVTSSMETE